jgi:hypothetical protein
LYKTRATFVGSVTVADADADGDLTVDDVDLTTPKGSVAVSVLGICKTLCTGV